MTSISDGFSTSGSGVANIGDSLTWTANNTGFDTNGSGQVTSSSTGERIALAGTALASTEHYSEVVVHAKGGGPAVRGQGPADFNSYHARLNSLTQVQLYRWFGTNLANFTIATVTLPGTLRLQVEDDGSGDPLLEAFWNGVSVGTYTDTSGSKITTGTYAGIYTTDTTAILDDFAAEDLAVADVTGPAVSLATIHGTGQLDDIYRSDGYDPDADELTVTVTATDAQSAVSGAEVNIDGAGWVAATFDSGDDWVYVIDVSGWAIGDHTIGARATSGGGLTLYGTDTVRHNPQGVYLRALVEGDPCVPVTVEA